MLSEEQARAIVAEGLKRGIPEDQLVQALRKEGYGSGQQVEPRHPPSATPSPLPHTQQSALKRGIHIAGSLALPQAGALIGGGIGSVFPGAGTLVGIGAGAAAGTFANEMLTQESEREEGIRPSLSPSQAILPTVASAAVPLAAGGAARIGARVGGIPQRAIQFLEGMTGEANIKGVGVPGATTAAKVRTAFVKAPESGMTPSGQIVESAESKLGSGLMSQVATKASRLQAETVTQQSLVDEAAAAGKKVNLSNMFSKMMTHIREDVKDPALVSQRDKLVSLAKKFASEADANGEVPVNRARQILQELRYQYYDPASTTYQAGKNKAGEILKNDINRVMGPQFARRANVIEQKLSTIENMQKRMTPLNATNIMRNLWGESGEDFRKMIAAYDQVHGTKWLQESYKLAIRRDLKPTDLSQTRRVGAGILGALGWAVRAVDRPLTKSVAMLVRPSGPIAGAVTSASTKGNNQ